MPVTFGSVGDIIAVCLLVKDLVAALDESRGSAADYQEVRLELVSLERALLEVEVLSRSHGSSTKLNALYATARKAALDCRQPVEAFLARIKRYDTSLGDRASKNIIRNAAMKIHWQVSQKDEVTRFRAQIGAHSSSINMILATLNVNIAQSNYGAISDHIQTSSSQQTALLEQVRDRLQENNALVSASNAIVSKVKDALRLDWVAQFGTEIKEFMTKIITVNLATYQTVISIQSVISGGLQRSLNHEPFILEDAIGRIAPVHMQFINSWDAFDAVLELRFRKIQGHTKVRRQEYALQEHTTHREILRTRQWDGAFLPGQKIDMSFIFVSEEEPKGSSCPSCKATCSDSQESEVQCQNCSIWYRRVTELLDEEEAPAPPTTARRIHRDSAQFGQPSFSNITYGPKPPSQFQALPTSHKRKQDRVKLEEDDLSQFKRIRLVTQERRKRLGPFSSNFEIGVSFDGARQQKQDEESAWTKLHTLQASLGHTHPDTLAYLHSFARSLRNWGKYQTAENLIHSVLESAEPELLIHRPEVLQLMLSGLMTILIDQWKVAEAEELWSTSVQKFRAKHGEDSADILEKQFQQAYPFRKVGLFALESALIGETVALSLDAGRNSQEQGLGQANSEIRDSSWSASYNQIYSHRASHDEGDEDDYDYVDYLVDGVTYRVPAKRSTDQLRLPKDQVAKRASPREKFRSKPGKATEADAKKHRIPPGYSLKNWDPAEEPIMILGSVFDANSLGKWVYDWTVYHYGQATPIADTAGELWLLLIQLAGKVKRSDECMPRIRKEENREMVEDFIESGERLSNKLKKLLKACEKPMLKASKKNKESPQLSKNAGIEFVESLFGIDKQLEQTEKFMSSVRLWNLRFDAHCEDILRRPGQ